jgi:hypothetical protein
MRNIGIGFAARFALEPLAAIPTSKKPGLFTFSLTSRAEHNEQSPVTQKKRTVKRMKDGF